MTPVRVPAVRRGSLLLYRFLDLGEAVDLLRVEAQLALEGPVHRVHLRREASAALAFTALPLEVELGPREVVLAGGELLRGEVRARVFGFGVLSVLLEVPVVEGTSLAALVPRCAAAWEAPELDALARSVADLIVPRLGDALVGPHGSPVTESYGVLFVESLEPDADPLLAGPESEDAIVRIVLGEADPRPISQSERDDVLRHAYRYFADDLAVVHWNSAFVLEPTGNRDVPTVLELATSQLLELRTHDERLDRDLDRVYAELARTRTRGWWLLGGRHGALARDVEERLLELVELADRAGNAVKMAADFFLARVYLAALRRVHVPLWRESVDRKLVAFREVYAVLTTDAHARRANLLELIVVLLILFEIVWALLGR